MWDSPINMVLPHSERPGELLPCIFLRSFAEHLAPLAMTECLSLSLAAVDAHKLVIF